MNDEIPKTELFKEKEYKSYNYLPYLIKAMYLYLKRKIVKGPTNMHMTSQLYTYLFLSESFNNYFVINLYLRDNKSNKLKVINMYVGVNKDNKLQLMIYQVGFSDKHIIEYPIDFINESILLNSFESIYEIYDDFLSNELNILENTYCQEVIIFHNYLKHSLLKDLSM